MAGRAAVGVVDGRAARRRAPQPRERIRRDCDRGRPMGVRGAGHAGGGARRKLRAARDGRAIRRIRRPRPLRLVAVPRGSAVRRLRGRREHCAGRTRVAVPGGRAGASGQDRSRLRRVRWARHQGTRRDFRRHLHHRRRAAGDQGRARPGRDRGARTRPAHRRARGGPGAGGSGNDRNPDLPRRDPAQSVAPDAERARPREGAIGEAEQHVRHVRRVALAGPRRAQGGCRSHGGGRPRGRGATGGFASPTPAPGRRCARKENCRSWRTTSSRRRLGYGAR